MLGFLLYLTSGTFCTVYFYFLHLLQTSLPKANLLTLKDCVLIVLAMLMEEQAYSVESLYTHVLVLIGSVGLNAYYAALSHSTMDNTLCLKAFVIAGLKLVDKSHPEAPFIIGCDDTTIKKFGTHFFGVGKLFDHSSHEKNKYINGHCFVSCCLKVPVHVPGGQWHYLGIPLGFRLWVPKTGVSKLDIAEDIIKKIMELLGDKRQVILTCDSWYTRSQLMKLTKQYSNFALVGNVRSDSVCREYDPPVPDPHKRGKKPAHGKKLALSDYALTTDTLNDFHLGVQKVACNILKDTPVWAFVSSPELTSANKSKRLFFSTIDPLKLARQLEGFENIPSTFNGGKWELYSPMLIYAERWILEVTFENMKTFWSLADYKVRDEHSLLTFVNLINLAYTGTVLLPYLVPQYAEYKDLSPQEIRKSISQQLWEEIDIAKIIVKCKDNNDNSFGKNSLYAALWKALNDRFAGNNDVQLTDNICPNHVNNATFGHVIDGKNDSAVKLNADYWRYKWHYDW